jgi:hypothetical protein
VVEWSESMDTPLVYADFQNLDDENRLRLTCAGTRRDLERQGVELRNGMALTLYTDDADDEGRPDKLLADGVVQFNEAEECWVAAIDWKALRHENQVSEGGKGSTESRPIRGKRAESRRTSFGSRSRSKSAMWSDDKPSGITFQEAESVVTRAESLGLRTPEGICILPRRFFYAKDRSELAYEESSQDVKILLRRAGIPLGKIEPEGVRIPYQAEHDNVWVGPVLFLGAAFVSQNTHLVSVALSTIANYLTDWFKGKVGETRVRLGFVIEKTDKKKTVRIDYDGPPDGVQGIEAVIKDALK